MAGPHSEGGHHCSPLDECKLQDTNPPVVDSRTMDQFPCELTPCETFSMIITIDTYIYLHSLSLSMCSYVEALEKSVQDIPIRCCMVCSVMVGV